MRRLTHAVATGVALLVLSACSSDDALAVAAGLSERERSLSAR
jgi:hypothetical protein